MSRGKSTIPKWLEQKMKDQGKKIHSRVFDYMDKQREELAQKKEHEKRAKEELKVKKSKHLKTPIAENFEKNYDQRHLFVLVDGQDLLDHDLKFSYIEINDRLSKFVPEKVWKSNAAQRLTLTQKIELSPPSQAMQEQSMLEILEEAGNKLEVTLEGAWLLDGTRIKSPLELPHGTRIIVVSRTEKFEGLRSMDKFDVGNSIQQTRANVGGATFVNQVSIPSVKVKPQPQTWVQMA